MALACAFIPFIRQRIGEMAGLSGKVQGSVTDNSIYVRKMIWSVDSGMLQHYWLTGCGPGRLMHLLKMRYFFHSVYYGYNVSAYDPHNEYFYNWLSFGLAGLLVLLALLIAYAVKALRQSNQLAVYLLLTLAITFFTESVLTTQHGLLFFTFFCNMYFFNRNNTGNGAYSA
jgi:O-antigen ligase